MKKTYLFLISLSLLLAINLASCKKCSICVVQEKSTGNQVTSSDEMCGNSTEVAAMEESFKNSWGDSYTVTCSTK
jgi:hypothetical protein